MSDTKIEYVRFVGHEYGGTEVFVRYEGDGDNEELLFAYYPDEIDFVDAELQGLTKAEALRLFHDRDVAYLQSP